MQPYKNRKGFPKTGYLLFRQGLCLEIVSITVYKLYRILEAYHFSVVYSGDMCGDDVEEQEFRLLLKQKEQVGQRRPLKLFFF